MGSIINTFKKFFTNRTTVTIIGVVAGIAVLAGFYFYRVNNAINPTEVPVATRTISATEEITSDDIEMVDIGSSFLSDADVLTSVNDIVGKYVDTGTSIPEGGMFYNSQVVEKEELPNSIFDQIPDGYTIYQLRVNIESTYSNSIFPGDKIDLWLEVEVDNMYMYDEFINSIEVIAVKDSAGNNVFDSEVRKEPAHLVFAVKTEMFYYISLIKTIPDMDLYPVPRNELYTTEGAEVSYSNPQLLQIIDSYASSTPSTAVPSTPTTGQ